jgi:hypothetical protein
MSEDNQDENIKRLVQFAGNTINAVFGEFTRESTGLYKGAVIVTSALDLPLAELPCYVVMDNDTRLRLLTRYEEDEPPDADEPSD